MSNKHTLPILVFIMLCLIWGSTWLFIKIGLDDAPPFLLAGARFLLSVVLLYPFMKLKGLKFPRDWRILSIMIYTGTFAISVSYGLVYWSEQYVSAGLTAVLFSSFPFFVLIFSHFMIADDGFSLKKIVGSIVGFSGVAVIYVDSIKLESTVILLGTSAIVVSAVFTAFSNVVIKKHSESLDPIVLTVVQMICGAVSLLTVGFLFENVGDFKFTVKSIGSLFYLSIVGSCVAFIAYYWLIRQVKVTTASLIIFVIPVVALFLDWLVLDQLLSWRILAGSGLVISGVGLASRR
ncbi:EamA family transporter [candidate division KSB1 bacterium]|nr:EamA family transporter [candidate division KSB1 bacterium]